MTDPIPVHELGYREALAEVEAILDRLEHDEPDVDRVAVDVARASALIKHCQERIGAARLQVDEVVGSLAADPPPSSTEPDAPGAPGAPGADEPAG